MGELSNYVSKLIWAAAMSDMVPDYTHLIWVLANKLDRLSGPTYGPILEEGEDIS